MKPMRTIQWTAAILAMVGMLMPAHPIKAAEQPGPTSPLALQSLLSVRDVALGEQGSLRGQVINSAGAPIAGAPVHLLRDGKVLTETTTDDSGEFAFRSLRGGVHQIVAASQVSLLRAWTEGTAPPSAQDAMLVVVDNQVARGQLNPIGATLANPLVMIGIIAAAVAVPIVIHNTREDKLPSS